MSSGHKDAADSPEARLVVLAEDDAANGETPRPVALDQQATGHPSRVDALQAQCQQRRRHVEKDRVEAALLRLESGEYGYCAVCGDEIGLERLEFDPAATTCIRCAGRHT